MNTVSESVTVDEVRLFESILRGVYRDSRLSAAGEPRRILAYMLVYYPFTIEHHPILLLTQTNRLHII